MNENQYININHISAETHAQFDAFAASIMADTMRELTAPNTELGCGIDAACMRKLQHLANAGLLNTQPNQPWSALDVAMATILTVLKKRGLSMAALRQIRAALNLPMYEELSVLGFAVLLCRQEHRRGQPSDKAPYLVIDGENRITLCRAADIGLICTTPEIPTYSHIVLNLERVLQECDFIHKIKLSHEAEFSELPAQILTRLFDDRTRSVNIDCANKRIKTISNGGDAPEFGERTIKYANGHIVADVVTTMERLDV